MKRLWVSHNMLQVLHCSVSVLFFCADISLYELLNLQLVDLFEINLLPFQSKSAPPAIPAVSAVVMWSPFTVGRMVSQLRLAHYLKIHEQVYKDR